MIYHIFYIWLCWFHFLQLISCQRGILRCICNMYVTVGLGDIPSRGGFVWMITASAAGISQTGSTRLRRLTTLLVSAGSNESENKKKCMQCRSERGEYLTFCKTWDILGLHICRVWISFTSQHVCVKAKARLWSAPQGIGGREFTSKHF